MWHHNLTLLLKKGVSPGKPWFGRLIIKKKNKLDDFCSSELRANEILRNAAQVCADVFPESYLSAICRCFDFVLI